MKAVKDNEIVEMSLNTYKSMYERLGYKIVSEKEENIEENVEKKKTSKK